jgi:hypothetical protein
VVGRTVLRSLRGTESDLDWMGPSPDPFGESAAFVSGRILLTTSGLGMLRI